MLLDQPQRLFRNPAYTTARTHVESVAEQTKELLTLSGFHLYAQQRGTRPTTMVRAFTDNPRGLLMGVRTFWEGIDIPGSALSHVWISKLPFPNLGDPLLGARSRRVEEAGGNSFDEYLLPLTVIQFKQGFGRLVRTRSDRGAVIVADRRLRSSMYRDVFLGSLPGPTVTEASDLTMYREIAAFLGLSLDEALLTQLPLGAVDEIISRYLLDDNDDPATLEAKLRGGLELFRLNPPPIHDFRGRQLEIMLASHLGDTLAILPTGAGKSLCFQLPGLLRDRVTLVVSPLVALMKDQVDRLRRDRGIRKARAIVHSVSRGEQEEIFEDISDGRCRLLYIAPERLRDQNTVQWLKELQVAQLVVDEAHCVSLWGPTFRPEFLKIRDVAEEIGRPPILALTATATTRVRNDIESELDLDLGNPPRVFTTSFDRPNLFFGVVRVPSRKAKDRELLRILSAMGAEDSAIVYVARKRDAERLASWIESTTRIPARAYHAGLEPSLRASIQEAFTENGVERLRVIVATKAFGMGIDKADVRYVIHYDMPDSIESYYQEAGRAGRDGKNSYCVLLYTPRDQGIQEFFIQQSAPPPEKVAEVYNMIAGLARPIPGQTERRAYLSVESLTDDSGVSDTTLRVILHHLESRGLLRRAQFDYGPQARVKLKYQPHDVLRHIESTDHMPEDEKRIASAAITALGFIGADDMRFDTLRLAERLGTSPVDLEKALLHLERRHHGQLIYRSWNRGIVVDLLEGEDPDEVLSEDIFAEQRSAAIGRLERMRGYILSRSCRRRYLLDYLDDVYSVQNCATCDNCVADPGWPWSGQVLPDSALDGGVDPEMEILKAVAWAEAYHCRRKQIEAALKGREKYGARGFWLKPYLRAAEFFGRLQYVPARRIEQAAQWLLDQNLIEQLWRPWQGRGTYEVLVSTPAGKAALQARRLPGKGTERRQRS